jgi:hypothetical protein
MDEIRSAIFALKLNKKLFDRCATKQEGGIDLLEDENEIISFFTRLQDPQTITTEDLLGMYVDVPPQPLASFLSMPIPSLINPLKGIGYLSILKRVNNTLQRIRFDDNSIVKNEITTMINAQKSKIEASYHRTIAATLLGTTLLLGTSTWLAYKYHPALRTYFKKFTNRIWRH